MTRHSSSVIPKEKLFLKFGLFWLWRNALGDGISTRPKFQKCRRPCRPSSPRFFSQNSTEIITIFHEIQLIQLKTKNILFCIWSSGLVVWSWYSDKWSFLSSENIPKLMTLVFWSLNLNFEHLKRPSTIANLNPKPFLNYFLDYWTKWFSAKEVV